MRLPAQSAPFEALLAAAEGRKPEDVERVHRRILLWAPDTKAINNTPYTQAELDGGQVKAVTRLALFGAVWTGDDPVLHYTSPAIPYNNETRVAYNPGAETTQLAEFAADKKTFEASQEGRTLDTADHRDYLVWALMDRIRGVNPLSSGFILNNGTMRIARLGRRDVVGGLLVGGVGSNRGQLKFDGSLGGAISFEGLGVVAGQQD
ncbi:hypothetical protein E6P97_02340 [Patescibacteria group bacterium]|nr:MAG: hypothetical protein E6P97_02340 [Patescibacteria group bacterium]